MIISRDGFKVDAFEFNLFHYINFKATQAKSRSLVFQFSQQALSSRLSWCAFHRSGYFHGSHTFIFMLIDGLSDPRDK